LAGGAPREASAGARVARSGIEHQPVDRAGRPARAVRRCDAPPCADGFPSPHGHVAHLGAERPAVGPEASAQQVGVARWAACEVLPCRVDRRPRVKRLPPGARARLGQRLQGGRGRRACGPGGGADDQAAGDLAYHAASPMAETGVGPPLYAHAARSSTAIGRPFPDRSAERPTADHVGSARRGPSYRIPKLARVGCTRSATMASPAALRWTRSAS
jgi:hypothetical protein